MEAVATGYDYKNDAINSDKSVEAYRQTTN